MQVVETASLLEQGIRAAAAGNRPLATLHLEAAIKDDAQNAETWLWLAWVADSPEQAESCLEWVKFLDPHQPLAAIGLQWVRAMRDSARFNLGRISPTILAQAPRTEPALIVATDELVDDLAVNPLWQMTPENEVVTSELVEAFEPNQPLNDEIDDRLAAAQRLVDESIEQIESHEGSSNSFNDEPLIGEPARSESTAIASVTPEAFAQQTALAEPTSQSGSVLDLPKEVAVETCVAEVLNSDNDEGDTVEEFDLPFDDPTCPVAPAEAAVDASLPADVAAAEVINFEVGPIIADDEMRALICLDDIDEDITLVGTDGSDFEFDVTAGPQVTQLVFFFETESTSSEGSGLRNFEIGETDAQSANEDFLSPISKFRRPDPSLDDASTANEWRVLPDSLFESLIDVELDLTPSPYRTPVEVSSPVSLAPTFKVLVADDSPTVRRLMTSTLRSHNFAVIEACDGVEAVKALAEHKPDLILLDINMPKLDGYQLCCLVKKHSATRHIPVLMLSGKHDAADRAKAQLVGCSAYFTKPFEPDQIVAAIAQQLAPQTTAM